MYWFLIALVKLLFFLGGGVGGGVGGGGRGGFIFNLQIISGENDHKIHRHIHKHSYT